MGNYLFNISLWQITEELDLVKTKVSVLAQLIKYFVPMNFHCYSYASLVEVVLINRDVFGESKT